MPPPSDFSVRNVFDESPGLRAAFLQPVKTGGPGNKVCRPRFASQLPPPADWSTPCQPVDRKSTRLNSRHLNLVCRLLLEKKHNQLRDQSLLPSLASTHAH